MIVLRSQVFDKMRSDADFMALVKQCGLPIEM
jgi:hypothetical protein